MIAEEHKVGLSTINKILKRFRNTCLFSGREGKCVRKSKTTPQNDRLLIRKTK